MTRIAGASVLEQELYDHVTAHGKNEGEVLQGYAELAETTDSPAFAYLARLILDDERRHHQVLDDLAETIRTTAELSGEPTPIPDLALLRADRERILEDDRAVSRVGERRQQGARPAGQRTEGCPEHHVVGARGASHAG